MGGIIVTLVIVGFIVYGVIIFFLVGFLMSSRTPKASPMENLERRG